MEKTFGERVKELTDLLSKILVDKNSDYGDSYAKSVEKHGHTVTLIRLEDKMNRLESLLKSKQQKVKDESIEDTLLDIAGYCLLELERRKRKAKVNPLSKERNR